MQGWRMGQEGPSLGEGVASYSWTRWIAKETRPVSCSARVRIWASTTAIARRTLESSAPVSGLLLTGCVYSGTSEQLGASVFGGCPLFGGSNMHAVVGRGHAVCPL